MVGQLTDIWRFRHFLLALVRLDMTVRYRRSQLGAAWSFLHPLLMTTVFVLVFSSLFGSDPKGYTTFLLLGLAVWGFFKESVLGGCQALVSNESYIRQAPLPYGLYTMRVVLGSAVHAGIAMGMALGIILFLGGDPSHFALVWAVAPAVVLAVLSAWAAATIFAFAYVYFRDIHHLLEVGAQILFFLTPIMYKAELLTDKGLGWMLKVNPVNLFLELIRTPLLTGEPPALKIYAYAALMTATLLLLAAATIRSCQRKLVFHL